jgi:hypothetical protein
MANTTVNPGQQDPGGIYEPDEDSWASREKARKLEIDAENSSAESSGSSDNQGLSANSLSNAEGGSSISSSTGSGSNSSLGHGFYSGSQSSTSSSNSLGHTNGLKGNGNISLYNPQDTVKTAIEAKVKPGSLLKSKWTLFGAGTLVLIFGVIIFFFLASLLIPDLAQNILTYQFARASRTFAEDNTELMSEKAALDATTDAAGESAIDNEYGSLSDGLLQKFKNLNPSYVIDNLESSGNLTYNYTPNSLGVKTLRSVSIRGQTIEVDSPTVFDKAFHPIQTFQNKVALADDVSDALQTAMREDGVGVIIRGSVEKSIQQRLGVSLAAWSVSKFKNDDPEQAAIEEEREAQAAIDPGGVTAPSIVEPIQNTEDDVNNTIQQDLSTDSGAEADIENGGVDPNVGPILDGEVAGLSGGLGTTILENVNTLYAVAIPVCIIYDGSIQSPDAAQTVQNNSDEDQRAFYYVESAADQQKAGATVPEAVGATNNKLGDISLSNALVRGNGKTIDTSADSISPQTAGNGQYTAANLIFPSAIAGVISTIANQVCPVITNPVGAAAITVVQIGSWFASDGGTEAAEAAAQEGVDSTFSGILGKFVEKITDALGVDESANVSGKVAALSSKLGEAFKPTKESVAKIAGLTGLDVFVRLDTLMKANETNNGLSQGNDLANQADAGGDLNGNEDMQQQFYGAPLSPSAVTYNNIQDNQYIADQNKSMNWYNRYLSVGNADSLLSKTAIDIEGDFNTSVFSSFFATATKVFNPSTILNNLLGTINPTGQAMADDVSSDDTTNYGIVQWGFTDQEQNLINNQTSGVSYQPLENDKILSGYPTQLQYIQNTYGSCFTDDVSILLNDTPDDTITNYKGPNGGNLFIVRNQDGDVISGPSGGICSNYYLGPNSADSMAYDSSDGMNDLIFRWRLQQSYDNGMDTLTGLSDVTAQ